MHNFSLWSPLLWLPTAALLVAGAAPNPERAMNEVQAVRVEGDGALRTIHVVTANEPAFTVFRLSDPMRVVVDVARGSVKKIDSPVEVNDGVVMAVATTQFADGKNVLGRLVITFEHSVDYEVKAVGNDIQILARDNTAQPVAAKHSKEPKSVETKTAKVEAKPEPKLEVAKVDPPKAEAKPAKVEIAKPDPAKAATKPPAKVEVAKSEPPRPAPVPMTVVTKTDDGTKDVNEKTSAVVVDKKLMSVRAQKTKSGTDVLLRITGGTPVYEILELEDPPRVVIDLIGVRAKSTHHPVYDLGDVGRLRLGFHADKVRLVLDGEKGLPEYQIVTVSGGLRIETAARKTEGRAPEPVAKIEPAKIEPAKVEAPKPAPAKIEAVKAEVAKVEPPKAKVAPVKAEAPKAEPVLAQVEAKKEAPKPVAKPTLAAVSRVEFKTDRGRAFVRVAAPPGTVFDVDTHIARAPALMLRDVQMPTALETSADESKKDCAISRLTSFNERDGKHGVRIIANLRGEVHHAVERDGDDVVWSFDALPQEFPSVAKLDVAVTPPVQVAGFSAEAAQLARTATTNSNRTRITLKLRGADLLNVLQLISEASGENIVAGDDVTGKVTLQLRNVPWDEALDVALQTKGYGRVREGNIIRVASLEKLQKEKESEIARQKAEEMVQPVFARIIQFNYASAKAMLEQIRPLLTKDRGKVTLNERTNSLLVEDREGILDKVEQLSHRLDTQTPQVLIESRIVEANTNYEREMGIQWGGNTIMSPATGNSTGLQFPNTFGLSGGNDGANPSSSNNSGTYSPPHFAVNLPAASGPGAGGALGFIFGNAANTAQLALRISALENQGTVRIVSAPKVTTLDNTKARISQGVEIPISVVSAAGTNTRFVDANLELEVTPHVTHDGSVMMDIKAHKNEPDFSRTGAQGDPTIQTKEAETQVLVKDGDTTVIGGIYTRNTSVTNNYIPFLGQIPVLGWLFKHHDEQDNRSELLVFITPRIVNRAQISVLPPGDMGSGKP